MATTTTVPITTTMIPQTTPTTTIPSRISITNLDTWYEAIRLSQLPVFSSSLLLFELKTNLTFNAKNPVYLKGQYFNGKSDTHYLLLQSNQEFRGNGYSITLEQGACPDNEAFGIFRLRGSTSSPAVIQHLYIFAKRVMVTNQGALLSTSFTEKYDPINAKIVNVFLQVDGFMESGSSVCLNHSTNPPENIWFENCQIEMKEVTTLGGYEWNGFLRAGKGLITFTNCSVVSMSLLIPTEIDFYLFVGEMNQGTLFIQLCFSEMPSQAGMLVYVGKVTENAKVTVINNYSITGFSRSYYEGMMFVIALVNRRATVQIENFYSNNNRPNTIAGVIMSNYGNSSVNNIQNRYNFFGVPPTEAPKSPGSKKSERSTLPSTPEETNPLNFLPTMAPFHERQASSSKKSVSLSTVWLILVIVFGVILLLMIIGGLWWFYKQKEKRKKMMKTKIVVLPKKEEKILVSRPIKYVRPGFKPRRSASKRIG